MNYNCPYMQLKGQQYEHMQTFRTLMFIFQKIHQCSSDSEGTVDPAPAVVYKDTSVPELRRTDSVFVS